MVLTNGTLLHFVNVVNSNLDVFVDLHILGPYGAKRSKRDSPENYFRIIVKNLSSSQRVSPK